ncbi:MAG: ROK family protein [Hyphomicrobiales bacterium]|nr:ROK family protein [Hyphomicrobiales bacterium]MBV8825125.1 ROK family protein [Hyphomicrobiales bacterium]MBV9427016.1 ROK family protein [Bradyrhizobiaceae bacterium]
MQVVAEETTEITPLLRHGALQLPSLRLDAYNLELKDSSGFVGDRASKSSFAELLDKWRKPLGRRGDPFGRGASEVISRKKLDALLADGPPGAAAALAASIEEFAQQLAGVIRIFLKQKCWREAQRIVVGGGMSAPRVGKIAIARACLIVNAEDRDLEMVPIDYDPDEAALIGATHLVPAWLFNGYDAILAVDIGGTNIRAGLVELRVKNGGDFSKARVKRLGRWRHGEEKNLNREDALEGLIEILESLIRYAKKNDVKLAPFIGVGCPGKINEDGTIARGAQNLPGNWERKDFNLPARLREAFPEIGGHETAVMMHNDAVVQGLSQVPFMTDVTHWGVLTIGTGFGNACFTNRNNSNGKKKKS